MALLASPDGAASQKSLNLWLNSRALRAARPALALCSPILNRTTA
jgi:hypothetical protein